MTQTFPCNEADLLQFAAWEDEIGVSLSAGGDAKQAITAMLREAEDTHDEQSTTAQPTAMKKTFHSIPIDQLPGLLPKIKRQVALGLKRIAITSRGDVEAYLVPISDIPGNLLPSEEKLTTVSNIRTDSMGWVYLKTISTKIWGVSLIKGQPARLALCRDCEQTRNALQIPSR